MRDLGRALTAIGVIGFLAALFLMPTTVPAGPYGTPDVVNIGLQQRQLLVAIGSLAIFLAGAVLAVGGAMIDAMQPMPGQLLALPNDDDEDEAATMERLGITRSGPDYAVHGFVYSTLSKAVAAASPRG